MRPHHERLLVTAIMLACLMPTGCSRRHYRLRADQDAYGLVLEKSLSTPWQLPQNYSVYPTPDSRLADPTNPDFPWLPSPGPILYSGDESESTNASEEEIPTGTESERSSPPTPPRLELNPVSSLRKLPPIVPELGRQTGVQLVSFQADDSDAERLPPPEPQLESAEGDPDPAEQLFGNTPKELSIQPVPPNYWNVLPASCLRTMLEFESVREEYQQTFRDAAPPPDGTGTRFTLREIIELAQRNSREYQTQKEQLYIAALELSLQRFDYQLRFSNGGNGTDVNYAHDRANGITVNTLRVPTAFQIERMLATGGNFVARFANDVLLTFNGPDGFASDVSSELLFDLTQRVLQRDILLQPLIQSERNLVYAAREFARFRKVFFFDVASQYYDILLTYRRIEIDTQNYLSLVRTLEQARAEVRAEVTNAPNQVAVDLFEQGMLTARFDLISTSNSLKQSLDRFKLTLGLPTDLPLDISLDELNSLTLLDEIEVALERIRRWRERVLSRRNQRILSRDDLLNASVFMLERVLEWYDLKRQAEEQGEGEPQLRELYARLLVEQARNEVRRTELEFQEVSSPDVKQPPILIYLRGTVLFETRLRLINQQLIRLESLESVDPIVTEEVRRQWRDLIEQLNDSRQSLARNPSSAELSRLLSELQRMLPEANSIVDRLDILLDYTTPPTEAEKDREAIAITDQLLATTDSLIEGSETGLPSVDIDVNDAMLTALIQRLDLMNERGFLADNWRRVKLAADDLRSILNLSASHSLRTDKNEPFDFDFDDSRTELRLSLDLPFNRRAQRNNYRVALIDYQVGRRSLMRLEDTIKFDIRTGIRNLELTRVQYPISVTSAALAYERVISIRLQLALGTPDVRGRDLLDALQDSRVALRGVAGLRIGYLVDRARFVLDLELMQVDENGFWPQISDPGYQPAPNLTFPRNAGPTYGELSPRVLPSRLMYHLYRHPLPGERIEQIEQIDPTRDVPREDPPGE